MGYHDVMQVCLNGHQITASYNESPQHRKDFCDKCGEKTINTCPNCETTIKGKYTVPGVLSLLTTPVPEHCHKCGKPYPWTEKKTKIKRVVKEEKSNPLLLVEHICSRFHLVARQLRERHDSRPTLDISDEYDVQDLLHALLKTHFDDIRPEEWTPSYAGGSSRMDFLLKKEKIVIEVKKTRDGLGPKEVGDQLLVDIGRYKEHPNCKVLLCFVYDPEGKIPNPKGLEKDLTQETKEVTVKVLVVPKGY